MAPSHFKAIADCRLREVVGTIGSAVGWFIKWGIRRGASGHIEGHIRDHMARGIVGVVWLSLPTFAAEPQAIEFFETRIRPTLVRHCYECHSQAAPEPKGGLLVDSRDGLRTGGDSGPAVVPGDVEQSLLLDALNHTSFEMPPGKKLADETIADFAKWIASGASDPRDAPASPQQAAAQLWRESLAERLEWWSLKPVRSQSLPRVRYEWQAATPLDRFVLAGLEQEGLIPAPPADRRTLIKRLYLVLLGLPPDAAAVEAFVIDPDSDAYAELVDQLLASPHFGERWARHWMDVVRYADTYGYEWDIPAKGAWRYRDYLTRAFNADVPFDQLVREQLAGDLLAEPRIDSLQQTNESLIGPMFYQLGENRHGDSSEFDGIHQEMLDNKIDAFSKAFQATTIACARCHDHKIDAVAQSEYYALAGTFMSSRWLSQTVDLPDRNATIMAELESIKSKLKPLLAELWRQDAQHMSAAMLAALENGNDKRAGTVKWRELLIEPQATPAAIESPLYLWRQLLADMTNQFVAGIRWPWNNKVPASATPWDLSAAWQDLAKQVTDESMRRIEDNAQHFQTVIDFSQCLPQGWSVDGAGLQQVTACGDFSIAPAGSMVVGQLLPAGLMTHRLSTRLNGAVRTPYLRQFKNAYLSFEYMGGDFAAQRTVIDNAFLTEKQAYLASAQPAWLTSSSLPSMLDRHNYIEFATKTSNPNFPPRVGLGGACSDEQIADPRSWFGITRAVLHDGPHPPLDELTRFQPLLAGPPPKTIEQIVERYASWFGGAIQAWSEGRATSDDVWLINWLMANGLLSNQLAGTTVIEKLVDRYRQTELKLAIPWTVNSMCDIDDGYDYQLNLRGEYDRKGDAIPRGYLQAITDGDVRFHSSGSGRLELAERVASGDNPLTARVIVNRNWQWLFGTGFVDTPNDFGRLGGTPSHPELLDWLTLRFVNQGWSIKRLLREILLSQTWQQSSATSVLAEQRDPGNRLLHHYPLRRLDAEMVRDAMLCVAGRIDESLYGAPIDPHRAAEDPQKRLVSGPIDGAGRRSIYTKVTIMEPARLLATFNAPDPKIPTGKRDESNTPAQSLTLLNDAFVNAQAARWAASLIQQSHVDVDARLSEMFYTAICRPATQLELNRWRAAVLDLAELHGVASSEAMSSIVVWQDISHAFFNLKEFLYYR